MKISRAKRRAVPYLQPGSGASVRAWLILFRVKLPASHSGGTPVFDQYGYQPGTGVDAAGYMPRRAA